ncbi:MAG: hypothetical protein CMK92_00430 [Pseudomonas sp.]|nr:hypothetical protein [Pseudomonas sp.]
MASNSDGYKNGMLALTVIGVILVIAGVVLVSIDATNDNGSGVDPSEPQSSLTPQQTDALQNEAVVYWNQDGIEDTGGTITKWVDRNNARELTNGESGGIDATVGTTPSGNRAVNISTNNWMWDLTSGTWGGYPGSGAVTMMIAGYCDWTDEEANFQMIMGSNPVCRGKNAIRLDPGNILYDQWCAADVITNLTDWTSRNGADNGYGGYIAYVFVMPAGGNPIFYVNGDGPFEINDSLSPISVTVANSIPYASSSRMSGVGINGGQYADDYAQGNRLYTNFAVWDRALTGDEAAAISMRALDSATEVTPVTIVYNPNIILGYDGFAITTNTPTIEGDVTSVTIDPVLPAGLVIDGLTGAISGTPTLEASSTLYTVTASSAQESVDTTITIEVAPAPTVTYPGDISVDINTIISLSPTANYTVDSYAIAPALPAGLMFDTTTGIINGTLGVAHDVDYTVTPTAPAGTTVAPSVFNITFNVVVDPPDPEPEYAMNYPNFKAFEVGIASSVEPTMTIDGDEVIVEEQGMTFTADFAGNDDVFDIGTSTGVITTTANLPLTPFTATITATRVGVDMEATITIQVIGEFTYTISSDSPDVGESPDSDVTGVVDVGIDYTFVPSLEGVTDFRFNIENESIARAITTIQAGNAGAMTGVTIGPYGAITAIAAGLYDIDVATGILNLLVPDGTQGDTTTVTVLANNGRGTHYRSTLTFQISHSSDSSLSAMGYAGIGLIVAGAAMTIGGAVELSK